jgi:hypothetical protein
MLSHSHKSNKNWLGKWHGIGVKKGKIIGQIKNSQTAKKFPSILENVSQHTHTHTLAIMHILNL